MAKSFPIPTHHQFQDLTGQHFSRWRVVTYAGQRGPHHYWNCVCDCGTEKAVAKNSLTAGKSLSCGCLKNELTTDRWERYRRQVLPCDVPGCDRPSEARGLCSMHYERVRLGKEVGDAESERGKRTRWVERHVGHTGPECLIWPFSVGDHGRGIVQFDKRVMSAPRYMCTLAHGEPPTPSYEAAHSCGKGHIGCVHPGHLSWKTRAENEADKLDHGTLRRGRDINTNKLTENQVREIRQRLRNESGEALASAYGVTPSQISSIKTRKTWAWLD